MVKVNPCVGVDLQSTSKERMLFLTLDQVRAVAEAIDPHFRVLVDTAAYTGPRAGELAALRPASLDPLRGTILVKESVKDVTKAEAEREAAKGVRTCSTLVFGSTKNYAERSLKLPEFLIAMLKDHLAVASPGGNGPDDLVFTTKTGAPIRQHLFYRRHFKPAVRRALPARLRGLRFHDLRHTCASLLLGQGAHALAVKGFFGQRCRRGSSTAPRKNAAPFCLRDTARAMSQENADVAAEVVEAVAQQNVAHLIELTDPEVEWHSIFAALGQGGVYRGHDGIRRYMSDLGDAWESMRLNMDQVLSVGAVVLMVGQLHYRGRGSGVETEAPIGIVAKFRQARIVYMRAFQEPEQAFLSVGLSE